MHPSSKNFAKSSISGAFSLYSNAASRYIHMYMRYPKHLLRLIESLKRLPGVGNKTAERFAFQMLDWNAETLKVMADLVQNIPYRLKHCSECGCLVGDEACTLCGSLREDWRVLCIISSPRDVFAIEETHEYRGLYHVLGTLLSPLEGKGPDLLPIAKIRERIEKHRVQEVIIALDSTLEGDATALYLKSELDSLPIEISRLALGLPMGSALDYVDGGTLARAFSGRTKF